MIVKAPYGLSPTFELSIDNAAVDYHSLNRFEIDLSENQHDMLSLELGGIPTRAITDYQNKGVLLTLNTGANYSCSFSGYVTDVHPVSRTYQGLVNNSPFQTATIVCLGASYAMRGKKNRVWDSYTLAAVAEDLCSTYGFSLDVPKDPLVYSPIAQVQESDWQFLVRYAKMLGYVVTAHGTHIHIFNPYCASDRAVSFNRLTTIRATQGDIAPAPGQVSEFRGTFTDDNFDNDTVITVRQNGTEFDVSSQGKHENALVVHNRLNHMVDNYDAAVRMIETSRKQSYDYHAHAKVSGLAGCYPGGVVDLDNYNADFDGLWYVKGVKHTVSSGAFVTDLELCRNKDSELVDFNNVQKFAVPPAPRFVNGRWEATKKVINEY